MVKEKVKRKLKKENSLFVMLFLLVFFACCLIILASSAPFFSYSSSTIANNSFTKNSSFEINATIYERFLASFIYNWNGTNYTLYNNSLVLSMNFDNLTSLGENSTRAVDSSLYSNNGTISGAVWNSSGKYGSAITFDGVDDYIDFGVPNSTKIIDNLTLSAWIKTSSIASGYRDIIANQWQYQDSGIMLTTNGDSTIHVPWSNGSLYDSYDVTYNFSDGAWHFIATAFSSGTLRVYADGVQIGNKTSSIATKIGYNNVNSLLIGKDSGIGGTEYFNGSIDEVRIWNRSLNDNEIYEMYVSNFQKFNSTQWNFYANQSQNSTSGLQDGTYSFSLFATNSSGTTNSSDLRFFNLDTTYPQFLFFNNTPENNLITTNNSFEINATIYERFLASFIYTWNGTNYTLYNNSLVLSMNFDNLTSLGDNSTRTVDNSLYSNNGTISGAVWNSSGKYGSAITFDGVNDLISVPDSNYLDLTSRGTIALWAKRNSLKSYQMYLTKATPASSSTGYQLMDYATTGRISFRWSTDYVETIVSSKNISIGNWSFIAVTYNGSQLRLYLDGALDNTTAYSTNAVANTELLRIGARSDGFYFNGSIDEVRIWNRSLNDNEIYEMYVSNFQKFNSTQWNFYANQSQNSTSGLSPQNYSYQLFSSDLAGNLNQTEQRNISIIPITWPQINLELIYPTSDINVTQLEWFNVSVNVTCLIANCTNLNITLDPSPNTFYTFTACNSTGRYGPNQTQCDFNYTNTTLQSSVAVLNGTQNWSIPESGYYRIDATGASGGLATSYASNPGRGAYISGIFYFSKGQIIKILVGQKGVDATTLGGGGGASFVASSTNEPLIVAGGGGGPYASNDRRTLYSDASNTTSGKAGEGVSTGGINGYGGSAGGNGNGASGGGGFYSDGGDGYSDSSPGLAFLNKSYGGAAYSTSVAGAGGFGGGGGSENGYVSSGGGGGYSGGGGGASGGAGGGGGSFNNGTNQINLVGNNTGNGYVRITYLGAVKSGTVSMNSSIYGFYTNVTNPYNLTLSVNESQVITWQVNATGTPNIANIFFVYANLTNNFSVGNQTLKFNVTILDSIAPIINITYPINTTYNYYVSSINYTYYDYSANGFCWYSNGTWNSSSVSYGTNFTNINSSDGSNILTVYCNDSSGNINSSTVIFSQRIPSLNITWIYPTENINVTQLDWFNVSVNISCLNGNCGEINVTLDPAENPISCKEILQNSPSSTSGNYTIYPYGNATGLQVYCDMVTDGGGWTLFANLGPSKYTEGLTMGSNALANLTTIYLTNRLGVMNHTQWLFRQNVSGNFVYYFVMNFSTGKNLTQRFSDMTSTGENLSWYAQNSSGSNFSGRVGNHRFSDGTGITPATWYSKTTLSSDDGTWGVANSTSGILNGNGQYMSYYLGNSNNPRFGYENYDNSDSSSVTDYRGYSSVSINNWVSNVYVRDGTVSISAKGGTVSMNSSATPFYTNVTNPYNLTLNEGESQIITWNVNATGNSPNTPYLFFVYANATFNQSINTQTSKFNVTIKDYLAPTVNITYPLNYSNYTFNLSIINYTYYDYSTGGSCWYSNSSGFWNSSISSASANGSFTNVRTLDGWNNFSVYCNDSSGNLNSSVVSFFKDSIYPVFSNFGGNNATMNGSGIAVFNVTILNTNGTVFLEINGSNYTANNISVNVWNYSLFLTNGTYAYRWISWGNFTLTNYNSSNYLNYTLYGNLRIVNLTSLNESNASNVVIPQGRNVTITSFIENAANVFLKIWRTFIGGQILWQGFMNNLGTNLWSITIPTNSTWPVGEINYTIYANDSLRNQHNMSSSFNVTDTTSPVISFFSPINNTFTNNATQYFSANITDNYLLQNVTLYIWNSTNSTINITTISLTGTTNITNFSVTLPYDNRFIWNYYACDNSSNCAWNNTNFTITYDSISPEINITYPTNTTLNVNVRALNYIYTDLNGNGFCWYSNGTWNSTAVSSGINFTNVNSTEGVNTWIVYCNDSSGNLNYSSVNFIKDTPQVLIERIYPVNNTNASYMEWFNVIVNVSCLNANCGEINVTLDPEVSTQYNFTNCGASGASGPTQANCNSSYNGTSLTGLVRVTSGIQNWTVPVTGTYTIEAAGAKGGNSSSSIAGNGSRMIGTFSLNAGTVLQILVGQIGSGNSYGGGGGGGTFVASGINYSIAVPLIVAGGGGAGSSDGSTNSYGISSVITINGTAGKGSGAGVAGVNGSGGGGGSSWGGGGGGGFNSSGSNAASAGIGGSSFRNGGTGGTGSYPTGGFGGGGSNGYYGGGGGGGYSGGGGGWTDNYGGGGGGSFNNGTNQNNTAGINNRNGYVTITYLGPIGKGGTVSMNSSATPFYTNVTNPYNLTLNEGESQIITWNVNATGTWGNTYEFFVYANLTNDFSLGNQTTKWNVTISNISIDLTAPVINLISPANATGSNVNISYFYANFSDAGELSNCTFYIWNSSSYLINSTLIYVSGNTNESNLSITLPYENAFKWNYYSCDNSSNCKSANQNYTLYYDITPPYFINASNTTIYNNASLSLVINASDNIRFESYAINWTGNISINKTTGLIKNSSTLWLGDFYVNITINDTANNINSSVILIRVLNSSDNTYPIFSDLNLSYENDTQYSPVRNYGFNITILNTNGTVGIQFNGTNYSLSNVSYIFNRTFSNLAGGTYSYYFWAYGNGTRNLYNKTSINYYTISQNTSATIYLYLNNSRSNFTLEKNSYTMINASLYNATGIIYLYKDGVSLGSAMNSISNNTFFNSSGIVNITAIFPSNNNYTGNSETWWVNVTAPPAGAEISVSWVYPLENINVSQNKFFNISANVSCRSANCQQVNSTLYYDSGCVGTAAYNIPIGTSNCSSIKSSTYACSKSYDNNVNTGWFSLTQSTPEYIYWDLNSTNCISGIKVYPSYTYDNQIVNVDISEDKVTWTRVLTSWRINNGSTWNENISFNEITARYVRLNFTSTPSYASVAEVQIKTRERVRGIVLMNRTTPFYTNVTNPYNLTLNVNESQVITWSVNATGNLSIPYQFYINSTLINNASIYNQTSFVNITLIDTTSPIVNITYPLNQTYIRNVTTLNYTYYDLNGNGFCWYSNGTWNSTAVSSGINFTNVNSTEGVNTWTVYCNDSFGNTNFTNVSFLRRVPKVGLSVLSPSGNIVINSSNWFDVSVNVSCLNADCGNINVTLDPQIDRTPRTCSQAWGASCKGSDPLRTDYSYDGCTSGDYYSNGFWVDEVRVDATTIAIGQTLNITCTFDCYSSSSLNNIAISYYNGTWNRIWSQNSACTDGNYSASVVVSGTVGTQKARCSIGYNNYATTGTCFTGTYSDNDDVNFSVVASGKSGTVSMNSSATPFYTNVTNPYNLTLNVNESQVITWQVNATGNPDNYTFFVYANLTENLEISNITYYWNVTIFNGTVPISDNTYPIFSNYLDNNGVQQGIGFGIFNVTILNTNGTVWLEVNNTNISATNLSLNLYNASFNFTSNRTYSYKWYAYGNGTLTRINSTLSRNYSVSLADLIPPRISILSPANSSYRTNALNFTLSINENASSCWYILDNAGNISMNLNLTLTGANSSNVIVSEGAHTIIFYCNDTSNNLNSSRVSFFTDTLPPQISFSSPENRSYNQRNILVNILNDSDARNIWINRGFGNETYTGSITKTFSEGSNIIYAHANDSLGNLNSTYVYFFIDSIQPIISVISPIEKTYIVNEIYFNITSNENSSCEFLLNNITYSLETQNNLSFFSNLTLPNGNYYLTYSCNDSLNNLGQKNLVFGIDAVPPQITLNSPVENGKYRNSTVVFNYTPMAGTGLDSCELWGNWGGVWHKNDSSTTLSNYSSNYFTKTLEDGDYIWNIWCNNTLNEFDWSSQGNISFSVDRTSPYVAFVSPTNTSYNTSIVTISISNNSDAAYTWWFNGSSNLTYSGDIDLLLADGNYTYVAYANDSAGNLNYSSVLFYVDTSYPSFANYSSNNASLIGNGTGLFNVTVVNTNGSVFLEINGSSVLANSSGDDYYASYYLSGEGIYSYYWKAYSNMTSRLLGDSSLNYYYVNATDKISSNISLFSFENNTYLNSSNVNFSAEITEITANISDTESGIRNATLSIYNSTGLVNQTTITNAVAGTLTQTVSVVVYLVDSVYTWFWGIFDFGGNYFQSENRTLIVDNAAPAINLISSTNQNSRDVGLEIKYSAFDARLSSCWYDDSGYSTGNAIENCNNLTGILWSDGQHNVTIYANDSSGNINSTLIRFLIDSTVPELSLNSPEDSYTDNRSYTTLINFNCSASDNIQLANISLYINNILSRTTNTSGTSNNASWDVSLVKGTYTWSCGASDVLENSAFGENRTLILNFADQDNDGFSDNDDNLYGRESDVNSSGVSSLNVTISGNSTYGSYNDTQEVAFFDNPTKIFNFTHNFSYSKLDLSKINLIKNLNYIIINLSGQLQDSYKKSIYLEDNNFASLCAKDAEISNISEFSADCSDLDEFDLTSCLGNSAGVSKSYVFCLEENNILRVDNLRFSAVKGVPITVENTSSSQSSSGGGGGSSLNLTLINNSKVQCLKDSECGQNNYCFNNKCYIGECSNNSQCSNSTYCWKNRCVKLFDVKILKVDSPIDAGNFIHFDYFLKAMANINNDVIVDFWLEKDGKKISSGRDTIFVGNFDEKTEKTKIFIPRDTVPGKYALYVSVSFEKYSAESYREIEIDKQGNISVIPLQNIFLYIVPALIFIILLLSIFIIRLQRKRINDLWDYEERWFLTHRLSLAVFYFFVFVAGLIIAMTFLGWIKIPSFADYLLAGKNFFDYIILPYIFFIIFATFAIFIISLILRKRRINFYEKMYGKGFVPKKQNYLENKLKKIKKNLEKKKKARHIVRHHISRLEAKRNKQIKEWKNKGYDTSAIEKNIPVKKQIKEWKNKGYDVESIEG